MKHRQTLVVLVGEARLRIRLKRFSSNAGISQETIELLTSVIISYMRAKCEPTIAGQSPGLNEVDQHVEFTNRRDKC